MERISLPAAALRKVKACDIVVVGSGYGGAIAAARLAKTGHHGVVLLERGRELLPGDYPADPLHVADEFQIDSPLGRIGHQTGLFDLRINDDISVLVGCGLGGTSLINANVALEPDRRVMQDLKWPPALRRPGALDAAFVRAQAALGAEPYPDDWPQLRKLEMLERAATALGAKVQRPDLYVTFKEGPNRFHVEQKACILCGDCNAGCNHLAKNTLLMNYLPLARSLKARIFCEVSVRWVESAQNDARWKVHYHSLDPDARPDHDGVIIAENVILAAGALGSTEILLRSAKRGLRLSKRLGSGFTGNGDTLGFAYDCDTACDSVGFGRDVHQLHTGRRWPRRPVGPAIAGVVRPHNDTLQDQFIIEENSWPGPIAGSIPWLLGAAGIIGGGSTRRPWRDGIVRAVQELESMILGPRHGAVAHSLALLGMSFDDGKGVMRLDNDRLRIDWRGVGQQPNAAIVNDGMRTAAEALGAKFVPDPIWTDWLRKRLITVHPLGGCCMGETVAGGVVDDQGRVFDRDSSGGVHAGLYVMDGAVIPLPLGANPSLTIAALAERNVALLVAALPTKSS